VTAYAAQPLSRPQRDKTEGNYMSAAENSRILRVGSNTLARRFRSSMSFPPPPKPAPLGFHRAHLSLRDQKTNENYELNTICQSHSTVAAPCHPLAAVFKRPLSA
jgi:hypothetical protein